MDKELLFHGALPVIGATSAILLEKITSAYGYTFGTNSRVLLGIIGAVQNTVAMILAVSQLGKSDDSKSAISKAILAHAGTALALAGLTAVAAKVNLISSQLSLFATAALTLTSLLGNAALTSAFIMTDTDQ